MKNIKVVYENKFCRIILKEELYILQSKFDKYNDKDFVTFKDALIAIGILPEIEKYTFNK